MRRFTEISILLSLLLTFSSPSNASSQTADFAKDTASLTQNRLVVFEAFMRYG